LVVVVVVVVVSGHNVEEGLEDYLTSALQLVQTSSPSYLLMASLDAARWQFGSSQGSGRAMLRKAKEIAMKIRNSIFETTDFKILGQDGGRIDDGACVTIDPLRITVHAGEGRGGYDLDEVLIADHGVYAELPAARTLTFAVGPGSTMEDGERLVKALRAVCGQNDQEAPTGVTPDKPPTSREGLFRGLHRLCSPREAYFSRSEVINTDDLTIIGRASAEVVCPYPPGIPILLPGEVVTAECLSYLRGVISAGGSLTGCIDSTFQQLRVLC